MEFCGKAVAVSMASSRSTRLNLHRPWPVRKGEAPTAASAICCARKGKLREFYAKAGGDNYKQVSADRVNGSKMNEVVHGIEASLTMGNGTAVLHDDDDDDGGGGVESTHAYRLGRFVEERYVYRQTFVIRSHEIGPDETATMETLMNLLQETALNHVMSSGLASDGFGATHQMNLRKLIWVVTRINIQVEKYSHWGDVIEIDTWVAASGKNGMRRDWMIRDCSTEQVREEVEPFYLDRRVFFDGSCDNEKIEKLTEETAGNIKSGLAPRWSDMDVNQHVNNVKYIGWIMESVPVNVLENYHLTSMTLEYRRECRQSNLLESLTNLTVAEEDPVNVNTSSHSIKLRSTHLLCLEEDKAVVVRGRAKWKRK